MGPNVRDAQQKLTQALPNGAGTVTTAAGLDLEAGPKSDYVARTEFLLTAPALTTAMLPNGVLMTYNIITSLSSNMSSPTTIIAGALVQTGAGGAGAVGNTYRFKPPSNVQRYIGLQAVLGATGGNASTVSATLEHLF
jgi:hypothetical protein